ncbi:hypothetical protein BU17DRAFT_66226 [Hysterangium stoloniferum]|nr:hypothetical protein BU17DRAFT_66226 [Hysterangium stoloniferum]
MCAEPKSQYHGEIAGELADRHYESAWSIFLKLKFRLSVSLINAVAGGAGYTIGMEKGEELIAPDGGIVRLVRPLREVTMKECAAYLRWRNLSVIGNKRMLSTPSNGKESIGSLTKGNWVKMAGKKHTVQGQAEQRKYHCVHLWCSLLD